MISSGFFSSFPSLLFIVRSAWILLISSLLSSSNPEKIEITINIAITAIVIAVAANPVIKDTAWLPFLETMYRKAM